jgi:hypothetical protein
MTGRAHRPSPAAQTRIDELAFRLLTPEEARAALAVPVSDSEREEVLAAVRWFRRRYPAPLERLAYVRRAYRRWTRDR